MARAWIGNGEVMPAAVSASVSSGRTPSSAKVGGAVVVSSVAVTSVMVWVSVTGVLADRIVPLTQWGRKAAV